MKLGWRAVPVTLRYFCSKVERLYNTELNSFASRIRACRSVKEGKELEAQLGVRSCSSSTYLINLLVAMYGRLGSLRDAKQAFDGMKERNVFSWTMVLSAFARNGEHLQAVKLYWQMHQDGVLPDAFILSSVLTVCSAAGALAQGKAVHESIRLVRELVQDTVVRNSLISMYARCGSLEEAVRTFDETERPDVISWNSVIAAHVQHDKGGEALALYRRMQNRGFKPQLATLTCVVDACASRGAYEQCEQIHKTVLDCGLESDLLMGNSLITMYGKCRRLDEARQVLDSMAFADVVSWTVMAAAYTQNGLYVKALKLLQLMDFQGLKPDAITFVSLFDSCACLQDLKTGRTLHERIILDGIESVLTDCLVNMYGKCGSLEEGKLVFARANVKDVGLYNSMMGAYTKLGLGREALDLFRNMDLEGIRADKLSFYAAFDACVTFQGLEEARAVESSSGKEFRGDVGFESAVLSLYSRLETGFEDAMQKFVCMSHKDVISWNGIISACNQHSRWLDSVSLFRRMQLEGFTPDMLTYTSVLEAASSCMNLTLGQFIHERVISHLGQVDTVIGNNLVTLYGKCGELEKSRTVFESMNVRGVVAWTAIITAYAQQGQGVEALEMFQKMDIEGVRADKVTFSLILDVCANLAALAQGRVFHSSLVGTELEQDMVVENTLVNMYGKCGRVHEAREVFQRMTSRDLVSWTSIIAAYAQQGHAEEAFDLFLQMQQAGESVDTVIYVKLMGGCNHAGLLKDARDWFISMQSDYGLSPVHENYACILDLLGRLGQIEQAEELLEGMPLEPDHVAWMSFLNACKVHNDINRGETAAKRLLQLNRRSAASYVLLSDIHAVSGRFDVASRLRRQVTRECGGKVPGLSWIEIKSRTHRFASGNRSHPRNEEIFAELQRLSVKMKEAGYVPDTKVVLLDVEEEEKEQVLCYHSEKQAMAFGLISTPSGSPLRVVKNLRVCTDCHTATKFISKITGRVITVRDANRFHEFRDGRCSCKDYW